MSIMPDNNTDWQAMLDKLVADTPGSAATTADGNDIDAKLNGLGGLSIGQHPQQSAPGNTPITLDEWILRQKQLQSLFPSNDEDLRLRLQLATAITKTLNDCYDNSSGSDRKVHRSILSPANILVETFDCGNGGKSLNVSFASNLPSSSGIGALEPSMEKDLEDLGRVFQSLFGANSCLPTEGEQGASFPQNGFVTGEKEKEFEKDSCDELMTEGPGRAKRTKKSSTQDVQNEDGLPLYLMSVISALTDTNENGERYDNVKTLLNDLKTASDKFDIYFRPFDYKEATLDYQSQLPLLPSATYGRTLEISILLNSLQSVIQTQSPAFTAISGHGGVGKSTLAKQIQTHVEDRAGYVIEGKFDANGSRPDAVLFQALGSFFEMILQNEDDHLMERMKASIISTIGFGIGDLIQSIPSLEKLVGSGYDSISNISSQEMRLRRMSFLLCKLFGAISDVCLIVLFLDDLHWCDETTLSVIQAIVTDPSDITKCLFVGCYRDENQLSTQKVTKMLDTVKMSVPLFTITLGPFDRETTNTLVSESLCIPRSLCYNLSTTVLCKTAGSPSFVINFLHSLRQDGLIRFSLTTRRWEYHIDKIMAREIPKEIVVYMTTQMGKLPQSLRLVLKLASCLGHSFDLDLFRKAEIKQGHDLEMTLKQVCQVGYIHEVSPNKFVWNHDQMKEAAYELIPENVRDQFHLLIGSRLLCNTPEDEVASIIYIIVGQLNKGIHQIQAQEQKIEVAQLNCTAGEQALKSSSFHSAADYFTHGIDLLSNDCWDSNYGLALNLHDAAQEALFVTGNFAALRELNSEVITHAKTFDDKLNSYNNLVRCLVSSKQIKEAISTCFGVLSEIGVPMPIEATNEACFEAVVTTKTMLARFPKEDAFVGLPRMSNTNMLVAMEFLQSVLVDAFNSPDPRMGVLIVSKLIQLTLVHGLCEASSFAFAMYGTVLVHGNMKDLEGGYFYGRVALKLLNLLGARRFKARIYTLVYGLTIILRDPLQASLDNLLEGHEAGCASGDVEYACRATHIYSELAFCSGQDLNKLKGKMRKFAKRALACNQMASAYDIISYLAAATKLTKDGLEKDIYQDLLNTSEEDLFKMLESDNDRRACFTMLNNRKLVHLFNGDMKKSIEVYELIQNNAVVRANMEHITTVPYTLGAFADGLICFVCARNEEENRNGVWMKRGEAIIGVFKALVGISAWNFSNKLYLLEAEGFRSTGDTTRAEAKYIAAITSARLHRFVHEEGLTEEKFADYLFHQNRYDEAMIHFANAKKCYANWGATALLEGIDQAAAGINAFMS